MMEYNIRSRIYAKLVMRCYLLPRSKGFNKERRDDLYGGHHLSIVPTLNESTRGPNNILDWMYIYHGRLLQVRYSTKVTYS